MVIKKNFSTQLFMAIVLSGISSYTIADTLESAMINAYQNNTEIKEAIEKLKAADEKETQARAGWRPTVTIDGTVTRSDQNISGDRVDQARAVPSGFSSVTSKTGTTTTQGSVTVRQNLFEGGRTAYAIQGATATIKAARASLAEVEQKVLLETVTSYLNLLTKDQEVTLLKTNEHALKKTLDATRDKFNVGEETRTSVAQAEANHAESLARLETAKAELESIKVTYERLTNKKSGILEKPQEPGNIPGQLQSAIDRSVVTNPTIIRTMYEETAARREIDRVNGALLPKIDVFASSTRTESDTGNRFVNNPSLGSIPKSADNTTDNRLGVNLSWSLYDGGITRSQKRENAHTAEQRRIAIETARRQVVEQLSQNWETFKANKETVNFYKKQVAANKVSLDGTEQELKVGSKILLDVLNAQRTLVDSQLNLVRAENAYLRSAYGVVSSMGMLTAKNMELKVDYFDPTVNYEKVRHHW